MNRKENHRIFIIDDDREVGQSLSLLLASAGYQAEAFTSVESFLEKDHYYGPGCILLDIFLNGRSGLDMQEDIRKKFTNLPIVFMTGHGSIPMSVQALKKGAVNFLIKPVAQKELLDSIEEALDKSFSAVSSNTEVERIKPLIGSLTAREFEVFRCVITGMLNKEIAKLLGIAEHTVKNHRLKITRKLGVKSVADLIHIAEKLNIAEYK